ncbi:hypothetical protein BD410DRAFT_835539 [Rickenella mellea]|uniref:Large ribosomal subunit protein mL46 n=1 Tax=Rickenella mellea TaxID=50990 RepID=A0A4Y7QK05_9AGAM|nr:hypothetical protein BD410DRAFT_835539 [Rickenella mellea]
MSSSVFRKTRWASARSCFSDQRCLATHATEAKTQSHLLTAGVVLNRAPILTTAPTPFERAFYDYQRRIYRALQNPFPDYFYFKDGSVLEGRFKAEERAREKEAFGKGFGEAVDDSTSILTDDDAEREQEQPKLRVTKADKLKDYKSLDRRGPRNLYLLIKGKPTDKYAWRFPQGATVRKDELLHEAAQRLLHEQCGDAMNTWIVGRRPIGLLEFNYPTNAENDHVGEKVFFMKGHIFAGQVKPKDDIADFAWLTKEEIEQWVDKEYWNGVKDILSDW